MDLAVQRKKLEEILAQKPNTEGLRGEIRQHDSGDMATDIGTRETEVIRLDSFHMILVQARLAKSKLDDGTYAICSSCDGEIPEKRLDAAPWVVLCCKCQERSKWERRPGKTNFIARNDNALERVV
jgi:DnaK suppressor protein